MRAAQKGPGWEALTSPARLRLGARWVGLEAHCAVRESTSSPKFLVHHQAPPLGVHVPALHGLPDTEQHKISSADQKNQARAQLALRAR